MTPSGIDGRLVDEWLRRAEDDALNARSALKHRDGTPAQVCFLAQQMAEKLLKGALIHFAGDAPFVHDLAQLIDALAPHLSLPVEVTESTETLSRYYVTARYPSEIPLETFTWERAEKAFAAAERVASVIRRELEKPDSPPAKREST